MFSLLIGNGFLGLKDEDEVAATIEKRKRMGDDVMDINNSSDHGVLEGHTLLFGGGDVAPIVRIMLPSRLVPLIFLPSTLISLLHQQLLIIYMNKHINV